MPAPLHTVDPGLDFFSPQFDATRALAMPWLQPPDPSVAPLDNIWKCAKLLPPELPESAAAMEAARPQKRRTQAQHGSSSTSLTHNKV